MTMIVTTTRHESGDVDFDLHNGSNQGDWIHASGFLRSSEILILEIEDEDNRIRVACTITESDSAFVIGLVMGYHQGLTRASDTDVIDQLLLKQDSDTRRGNEVGHQGPDFGVLHTRLDCTAIIHEMLKTLHPDWGIHFSDSYACILPKHMPMHWHMCMGMCNNDQLGNRIENLIKGINS